MLKDRVAMKHDAKIQTETEIAFPNAVLSTVPLVECIQTHT